MQKGLKKGVQKEALFWDPFFSPLPDPLRGAQNRGLEPYRTWDFWQKGQKGVKKGSKKGVKKGHFGPLLGPSGSPGGLSEAISAIPVEGT